MYARLADNTLVFIREIRPDDKERLADGHGGPVRARASSSASSGPKPTLSASELRYLTEVDGYDHYAIVAVAADDEERIVAVARFVRLADDPARRRGGDHGLRRAAGQGPRIAAGPAPRRRRPRARHRAPDRLDRVRRTGPR